jgi:hypothetical protein
MSVYKRKGRGEYIYDSDTEIIRFMVRLARKNEKL